MHCAAPLIPCGEGILHHMSSQGRSTKKWLNCIDLLFGQIGVGSQRFNRVATVWWGPDSTIMATKKRIKRLYALLLDTDRPICVRCTQTRNNGVTTDEPSWNNCYENTPLLAWWRENVHLYFISVRLLRSKSLNDLKLFVLRLTILCLLLVLDFILEISISMKLLYWKIHLALQPFLLSFHSLPLVLPPWIYEQTKKYKTMQEDWSANQKSFVDNSASPRFVLLFRQPSLRMWSAHSFFLCTENPSQPFVYDNTCGPSSVGDQ